MFLIFFSEVQNHRSSKMNTYKFRTIFCPVQRKSITNNWLQSVVWPQKCNFHLLIEQMWYVLMKKSSVQDDDAFPRQHDLIPVTYKPLIIKRFVFRFLKTALLVLYHMVQEVLRTLCQSETAIELKNSHRKRLPQRKWRAYIFLSHGRAGLVLP